MPSRRQHRERDIELNYTEMCLLSERIRELYIPWVENSPWSTDPFLTSRKPTSVTVRFGHDQELKMDTDEEYELTRAGVVDMHQWDRVKHVSLAIATDLA